MNPRASACSASGDSSGGRCRDMLEQESTNEVGDVPSFSLPGPSSCLPAQGVGEGVRSNPGFNGP